MRFHIPRLETVANIVTIIVLLFFTVVVAQKRFDRYRAPGTAASLIGKRVPVGVPMGADSKKRALLLFVSEHCKYCLESMAFYRHLHELSVNRPVTQIAFVYPRGETDFAAFLERNGVETLAHYPMDFWQVNVTGTPTIALVDETGVVRRVWVGLLSSRDESEILQLIT